MVIVRHDIFLLHTIPPRFLFSFAKYYMRKLVDEGEENPSEALVKEDCI